MGLIKKIKVDELEIRQYDTRKEMGVAAGEDIGKTIHNILLKKDECNIIFAAAPSQNEMLAALASLDIPWEKINAFHMDEYIGLSKDAPQGFGNFLKRTIFDKFEFKNIFYLNGQSQNYENEIIKYSNLLIEHPVDIVCMGIGENGHIAFNDPHVADFADCKLVKVVSLDEICRTQQVNDGCFNKIEDVPTNALTLTIPALIKAQNIFCVVPGSTKAEAVKKTIYGKIETNCPASILRNQKNAILYIDLDSGCEI